MAKTIITIGREYCTGGNYIAEDVANALGIKLYDKELITMAAKHSGLSEEAVAASEKRRTHSLLYSLYTMGNELPLGDQVFILQSRIIKQLAEEKEAGGIVYGLPLQMNGEEGETAAMVRKFAEKVYQELPLPYTFWDERLSSKAMENFLIKQVDMSRGKRKQILDSSSAAYILQGALDALSLL